MIVGVDFGSGASVTAFTIMTGGRLIESDHPWSDVASDQDRASFLDTVEDAYGLKLSDADREGIQTVGDLTSLVERLVNA